MPSGAQILDVLMARFGQRTDAALRAATLLEMNMVVQVTYGRNMTSPPWFLLWKIYFNTTANNDWVSLNDNKIFPGDVWAGILGNYLSGDFMGFDPEGSYVRIKDPNSTAADPYVMMQKKNFAIASRLPGANALGMPEVFDVFGGGLTLRPIPDKVYMLEVKGYWEGDTEILDVTDNPGLPWLKYAPDVIMAAAGLEVAAKHLQDQHLASQFGAELKVALARLQSQNERYYEVLTEYGEKQ